MFRTRSPLFLFVAIFAVLFMPLLRGEAALTVEERKKNLETELAKVEAEIAVQAELLKTKRKETASIERDIAILNAQIKQAQLEIKARSLAISTISKDIGTKEKTILTLEEDLAVRREYLKRLLQNSQEYESSSLPEVLLGNEQFSDFYSVVDSLQTVQTDIRDSMDVIRGTKAKTQVEKQSLEEKKVSEASAKLEIESKKQEVETHEKNKQGILTVSKSQEAAYAKVLAERRQRAADIRSALFSLRDSSAIPFGKALEYANSASAKTGIRPAFLLAILTQETNLGKNIGTCNRPGDPVSKQWKAIMPGPGDNSKRDDETVYLRITKALGLDPTSMPLSCPMGNGWGGAMGPSQFIPTTWAAYESKIAAATGHNPPNPWEPEDAFMASAIYLSELGASKQTFAAEREAALRYYAGGNWSKPANAFYGDSVMKIATNIQQNMIDPLQDL